MKTRLLILLVLTTLTATAQATPWYESASFACGDPLTLRAGLLGSGWLTKPIPFVFPSSGQLYIAMSLADFKSQSVASPFDSATLSAAQATSLRNLFSSSAQNAETEASAASITSYLTGLVTHIATSTVIDQLLSYLSNQATTHAVTARIIGETVAAGGALKRMLTPARDARGHEYVYDTISYDVSVGTESRSYLLTSCYFPVKIIYARLKTVSPLNNKIFTRLPSGRWRSWDVDGAKYEGNEWDEFDRDDDYLYFREVGFTSVWRISVHGGAWQNRHADGTWGTLYAQVTAE